MPNISEYLILHVGTTFLTEYYTTEASPFNRYNGFQLINNAFVLKTGSYCNAFTCFNCIVSFCCYVVSGLSAVVCCVRVALAQLRNSSTPHFLCALGGQHLRAPCSAMWHSATHDAHSSVH